jgi:hypothetical protein
MPNLSAVFSIQGPAPNGRPLTTDCHSAASQPCRLAEVMCMHVQVSDYQRQNGPRYSLVVPRPVEIYSAPQLLENRKTGVISRVSGHRLPILYLARCGGWRPKNAYFAVVYPQRPISSCGALWWDIPELHGAAKWPPRLVRSYLGQPVELSRNRTHDREMRHPLGLATGSLSISQSGIQLPTTCRT